MHRIAFGAIVLIALILTACGRDDEADEPTSTPPAAASPTDMPAETTPVGPSTVRTEDDEAGDAASPRTGESAAVASPPRQGGDGALASPRPPEDFGTADAGTAAAIATETGAESAANEPSPSGAGTAEATTVVVSPTIIPASPTVATTGATPQPGADASPRLDEVDSGDEPPAASTPASPAAVVPDGMPDGAERAQVEETVDGDTIVVRLDGRLLTVELMGVDAPEEAEEDGADDCYAADATDRLNDLLGTGRVVWLELPENVGLTEEPASRYVWVVNADGDPYMVNRSMVRHGFALAVPDESDDPSLNMRRLADAEDDAAADGAGMWTACGLLEATAEATAAVITTCAAFRSFGDAQTYYSSRPDAQPFIDPNFDGRACEFWFGVASLASGGGTGAPPPAPAPAPAPAPSGQGRDGADGASGQDGNQRQSGDSVGEPGDDSNVGG